MIKNKIENKKFKDLVADTKMMPTWQIVEAFDNNTYPLSGNKFLGFYPSYLAAKEWERCLSLLKNRMGEHVDERDQMMMCQNLMMMYPQVQMSIMNEEKNHIEDLKKLTEEIVKDILQINDGDVNFDLDIVDPFQNGLDSSKKEEEPEEFQVPDNLSIREEYVKEQANKRLVINAFAHGVSIYTWTSSYYIAKDKIDEINPNLISLYDKYSAIIQYLNWMFPPEHMKQMIESNSAINQGYNEIEPEEEEAGDEFTIKAVGMNFPVLLHEACKGVIELISYNEIPEDMNEKELEMYYEIADEYTLEPWFYYTAPTLWSSFIECLNELNDSKYLSEELRIPEALELIFSLEYDELSEICINFVHDKESAIRSLKIKAKNYLENN